MGFPPDVCSPWTFAVAHHRRSPAGSIRFVARLAVSPVHRCGDLAWQCAARNHRAFSVIALLIALRQLVFYLSGITEVILQNDMRSRLFRFVLGRKLYAVKHQAEAGSGKPASDMLSGDISQRLERDLSSASSVVTDILPTIVVTLVQLFGAFFLMRSIDSILAWSLLVLTPVVAVCAKYLGSRLKKMTLAIREEESSIQMMIQETVEHELTIKTLQAESTVSGRVGSMQQRLHHLVRRRIRLR